MTAAARRSPPASALVERKCEGCGQVSKLVRWAWPEEVDLYRNDKAHRMQNRRPVSVVTLERGEELCLTCAQAMRAVYVQEIKARHTGRRVGHMRRAQR